MNIPAMLLGPRAVAVLGLALLTMSGLWWQRGVTIDGLEASASLAADTISAQSTDIESMRAANREFEALAEQALDAAGKATADSTRRRIEAAQRVAQAQARERDASNTLRGFVAQFEAATRDPGCAQLLATPVCPTLQEQ